MQDQVQDAILDWYAQSGRDLPWRRTRDPYAILVAEVMLQQTQVDRVLPKYQQWLTAFPTLSALAQAPLAEAIRLWSPLGYNRRAVSLHVIAQEVERRFDGQLPLSLPDLLSLTGIGHYTAGAIACFAGERQVAFWDTNVRRVLTRIFRGPEATLSETAMAQLAAAVLPAGRSYAWHQALMDVGSALCTQRKPSCQACPAGATCASRTALLATPHSGHAPARRTGKAIPFESTNRYFRGRVMDVLRQDGQITLDELGRRLNRADAGWLAGLIAGLARDGLLVQSDHTVSLP